jgi:hypothetical protein
MSNYAGLNLEQSFSLRVFSDGVSLLNRDELKELLVDLYANSMIQEKLLKDLLIEQMRLNETSQSGQLYLV